MPEGLPWALLVEFNGRNYPLSKVKVLISRPAFLDCETEIRIPCPRHTTNPRGVWDLNPEREPLRWSQEGPGPSRRLREGGVGGKDRGFLGAPGPWAVFASFSLSLIPCPSQKRNQGLFLPAPDPGGGGGGRGRGWGRSGAGRVLAEECFSGTSMSIPQ